MGRGFEVTRRAREQSDAWERLLPFLDPCTRKTKAGKPKASLLFIVSGWRSTSSGLTAQIEVRTIEGAEVTSWLTFNIAKALGRRFNRHRETISMGGFGYCRTYELASCLAQKLGKPIHCQTVGESMAPQGWVSP
jgi:hypothetical protein